MSLREIPLRIYLPAGKAPAPVVLFSHGLGGRARETPTSESTGPIVRDGEAGPLAKEVAPTARTPGRVPKWIPERQETRLEAQGSGTRVLDDRLEPRVRGGACRTISR